MLLTPSSPAEDVAITAAATALRGWGLRVRIEVTAPSGDAPRYLAGTDQERADVLRVALASGDDVRAIFCARGGYGAMRLLELEPPLFDETTPSRWLIGSSDTTALHLALACDAFRGSVYGPMPATSAFGGGTEPCNAEALRRLLFDEQPHSQLRGRTVVPGHAQAALTGGCLSLVSALIGTKAQVQARGRIVLLEDVGEPPYRLDRLLTSLRLSACLEGAVGIAIGSLHECGVSVAEENALLHNRLGDLGVPVVAGLAFGHGPVQRPLALHGPIAELNAPASTTASLSQF